MARVEYPIKAENRWVTGFSILVLLITSLPVLIGFFAQGETFLFTGFVVGVEDGNSYIAKMLSGSEGAWLFRTPYTISQQKGTFLFLPYILLGKLVAPPGSHEQLVVIYHLFRILAGYLAIKKTYDFIAYFVPSINLRRLGLVLCILGGGVGWIFSLLGINILGEADWLSVMPLEFYSPEAFGFLGIYGFPHLAMARALLLWTLLYYLKSISRNLEDISFFQDVLPISLCWILAGVMQPLTMIVVGVVMSVHLGGWRLGILWGKLSQGTEEKARWKKAMKLVVLTGVMPGLLAAYEAYMVWVDSFLRQWTAQNIIPSPHPVQYLLAYGLVLPFAFWGGRKLLKTSPVDGWIIVGWVFLFPFLAYTPVNLQRRLIEGVWVAWVVLTVYSQVPWIHDGISKKPWIRLTPLTLCMVPSLILLAGGLFTASSPSFPAFRAKQEVQMFEWLRTHAEPGSIVLSAYETANALPAWAPMKVVIGHGPESAGLEQLRPKVETIYSTGISESVRVQLMDELGVNYVIWGPAERNLGDWDPNFSAALEWKFSAGNYQVFEVIGDD